MKTALEFVILDSNRWLKIEATSQQNSQSFRDTAEIRLFCRAVTLISSQRFLQKMTNSRAVLIARIHVRSTSKLSQETHCSAAILSNTLVKCRNISYALGNGAYTRGEILSRLSLSYTSMATNAEQRKWRQRCIPAVCVPVPFVNPLTGVKLSRPRAWRATTAPSSRTWPRTWRSWTTFSPNPSASSSHHVM